MLLLYFEIELVLGLAEVVHFALQLVDLELEEPGLVHAGLVLLDLSVQSLDLLSVLADDAVV